MMVRPCQMWCGNQGQTARFALHGKLTILGIALGMGEMNRILSLCVQIVFKSYERQSTRFGFT